MNNSNLPHGGEENKSRARSFWKHAGFVGIALVLAIVTVFVLHLNVG